MGAAARIDRARDEREALKGRIPSGRAPTPAYASPQATTWGVGGGNGDAGVQIALVVLDGALLAGRRLDEVASAALFGT